ncbi:MAG: hypothetical protein ACRD3B_11500 [Candidatus Sulfotelmatobacter sp.]
MRLLIFLLMAGWIQAQTSAPPAAPNDGQKTAQKQGTAGDDLFPQHKLTGKISLVRGTLKQVDPIHDQMIVRAFGGGDVRIGFDGRTQLAPGSARAHVSGIPAGSVVSVDTDLQNGNLFARSVRVGAPSTAELNGRILEYDPAKARLTLRDPISPENIFVRVTPHTTIMEAGKSATAQALSQGALVKVSFSAADKTAQQIEILAERGSSFTFQGRILAVDLRARTLSLSNDTDHSLRELAFGSLDGQSLSLLKEGSNVSVQAEFDGERYNIRSVSAAPRNQ